MPALRASLCALALCLGCSSTPQTVTAVDAGVDAPPDIPPIPDAYIGPGSVHASWTVNGMPAAAGCAAAGATTVHLTQRVYNIDERVPCADGEFNFPMVPSTNLSLTGELLGASDNVIFTFTAVDTVRSGQALEMPFPFGPPGSLVVNWTINGMRPNATLCQMVQGYGVVLTVGLGSPIQASFGRPMGILCTSGRYRFTGLQASTFTIEAELVAMMGARIATANTSAAVMSGAESSITFDFSR